VGCATTRARDAPEKLPVFITERKVSYSSHDGSGVLIRK
jgi:hypothetical protein